VRAREYPRAVGGRLEAQPEPLAALADLDAPDFGDAVQRFELDQIGRLLDGILAATGTEPADDEQQPQARPHPPSPAAAGSATLS
jgi:hypothetical protein